MAMNYNVIKKKFITESFCQEDFTNGVECINSPLENTDFDKIEVASQRSRVSADFSSVAGNIWSKSSHGKNSAAELLETNIKNSTPAQCSNNEFWQANVAVGTHLSWDQWQPVLKTVANALCRDGVDLQADMVFAQVFLNALKCSDEQRAVLFNLLNEPKHIHADKMQSERLIQMLNKQNVLLKRINNKSARQEMKQTFRG